MNFDAWDFSAHRRFGKTPPNPFSRTAAYPRGILGTVTRRRGKVIRRDFAAEQASEIERQRVVTESARAHADATAALERSSVNTRIRDCMDRERQAAASGDSAGVVAASWDRLLFMARKGLI